MQPRGAAAGRSIACPCCGGALTDMQIVALRAQLAARVSVSNSRLEPCSSIRIVT